MKANYSTPGSRVTKDDKNVSSVQYSVTYPEIILDMGSANERRRYTVTPPLIGWAPNQNDPWYLKWGRLLSHKTLYQKILRSINDRVLKSLNCFAVCSAETPAKFQIDQKILNINQAPYETAIWGQKSANACL